MIARLRLDGGHHILYDRPQRTEHRAECIERPWRVRGVPTPKSVRLHRPRLKTPACTSRCFQHVLVPACAPADRRGRPVGDGGHGFPIDARQVGPRGCGNTGGFRELRQKLFIEPSRCPVARCSATRHSLRPSSHRGRSSWMLRDPPHSESPTGKSAVVRRLDRTRVGQGGFAIKH